jgi:preprotein translocase subunit SecY
VIRTSVPPPILAVNLLLIRSLCYQSFAVAYSTDRHHGLLMSSKSWYSIMYTLIHVFFSALFSPVFLLHMRLVVEN